MTTAELSALPPPEYLLRPFIVKNGITLTFGASGSYKSFLVLDWSCCVAGGVDWHGTPINGPGPVLYIAAEGAAGTPKRLRAWSQARGISIPDALTWIPDAINLRDDKVTDDVLGYLVALDCAPALIVVETFNRVLAGGNENSSDDVGKLIRNLDRIRAATHAAILVTHHVGWENQTRERGWSGWRNALEQSIQIERPAPLQAVLKCRKAKDEEEFEPVYIRLVPCGESLAVVLDKSAAEIRDETIRAAILTCVAHHPGCSTNQITGVVAGRSADVRTAREALIEEGAILTTKGARGAVRHYTGSTASQTPGRTGTQPSGDPVLTASQSHRPRWDAVTDSVATTSRLTDAVTSLVDLEHDPLDAEYERLLGGGLS